jgi:hypothetical protein
VRWLSAQCEVRYFLALRFLRAVFVFVTRFGFCASSGFI